MQFSVYQESHLGGRKVNQDRMGYSFTRDALGRIELRRCVRARELELDGIHVLRPHLGGQPGPGQP